MQSVPPDTSPRRLPWLYRLLLWRLPRRGDGVDERALVDTLLALEREYAALPWRRRWWLRLRELTALARTSTPPPARQFQSPETSTMLELLVRDLLNALRCARRAPLASLVVVATLALGIGANTAIFSVVDAVLLAPLPYPDSDRLMFVWQVLEARDVPYYPSAEADIIDYATAEALTDVGGIWAIRISLVDPDGPPERVPSAGVTWNFFDILGVQPALGRGFTADDRAGDGDNVVVISWELWQRRYGADPDILGRRIQTIGDAPVVVGVMPPAFRVLLPEDRVREHVDVFRPRVFTDADADRSGWYLVTVARLAPTATVADAQAQLAAINEWQYQEYPIYANAGTRTHVDRLAVALTGEARARVWPLAGAVGFVLLIACVNVVNLLIVRASSRSRELAVRAALGAGRARLVRESIVEVGVLAVTGALAGLALAFAGLRWLIATGPTNLPRLADASIDPGAMLFTAAVSLAVAMMCGLVVGLRASGTEVIDSLRGREDGHHGHDRLRRGLVVVEVALSIMLLVGAGLMLRSVGQLLRVDLGFDPTEVVTFGSSFSPAVVQDGPGVAETREQMRRQLAALPGVSAVATASALPLTGSSWATPYGNAAEVDDGDESDFRQANVRTATPGYFSALGTAIVGGRDLDADDLIRMGPDTPPATREAPYPVVVDRIVAERSWPGRTAVGELLYVKVLGNAWLQVVGVVEPQRQQTLTGVPHGTLYLPDGGSSNLAWILRTTREPADLLPDIRAVGAEIDPLMPITNLRSLTSYVDDVMAPARFAGTLLLAFALVAVVLASIGLYGVLAWNVRQRTREIGVRVAVGATAGGIRALVVRQGLFLVIVGIAIGEIAALALSGLLGSIVFGVEPTDPITYASIAVLFLATGLAACWIPARRATRVDPLSALKDA